MRSTVASPTPAPPRLGSMLALAAMLTAGCQGSVGDPGRPADGPFVNDPVDRQPLTCTDDLISPGRAPLQRLTVVEYDNTLRDLLGDTTAPALRLVDGERGVVNADARSVSPLLAEQYMFAAEDVAQRAVGAERLETTLSQDGAGCVSAERDDACARDFIEAFGFRAYRRPLRAEEAAELVALFELGRDASGFEAGVRLVIEAALQSPSFLYRVESGTALASGSALVAGSAGGAGGEVVRLDGYPLATRLSYFLWRTMPDASLLAAAEAGELATAEGVEAQARRMLADSRAEAMTQGFFAHYLELENLADVVKDPAVYPDFDAGTAELFRQEAEAFIREVVVNGDGDWRTLMSAPWTMMNADLAQYYGVDGPTGDDFERVDLDSAYHAGILTQGGLMSMRARTYETSPIHRGMFVRGTLLCHVVPDVPEGLDVDPPDPDESLTTRERLAEHRADPTCASCHAQIDPLGFAFEHFDGAGRFRATENGLAIDATGVVVSSDIEGGFDGAVELAAGVVDSAEAQRCFARQWFRYGYGRGEQRLDRCTVERLADTFRAEDFDIRELIVALTLSDTFLYRAVDQDTVTEGAP